MIPRPELDGSSGVPLYRQLANHFTRLIDSNQLELGGRLPATRELAGLLGLNRNTISAAYELLESEGLVSGQVGRGSFVTGRAALGSRSTGIDWERMLGPAPMSRPASPASAAISFAVSRPSEELFPLDAFRATCQEVMNGRELADILQLGSPGGYEPLRQYLLEAARREGSAGAGDDLIITNGCQQALDLLRRVLVERGDGVALEDPVYPGVKNLFLYGGAQLMGVPVGNDGLDVDQLEKTLSRNRPKLLTITPNFQNPTGATVPLSSRHAILRLARDAGVIVIENDIYSALRYEGDALPALKQLDGGDGILLRSFSKIAFPGLRIGWVIGPRPLIARLMEAKQLSDLHTGQFSQAVLLRFAQSGRLEAHQSEMVRAGAERLRAVLQACERRLPAGARFTRPQGGMNVWVNLPEPLDTADLLPRAIREGVSYLPGKYFAVGRDHAAALRLSFAGLTPELIERGVSILGRLFAGEIEVGRWTERQPAPALV